jgi:hypothetical protein
MSVEFKADGTYLRVMSLDTGITFTYGNIAIDEEGTYEVHDGTVTLTPMSGHYRKNGVDEGFELKVRQWNFQLEPNADRTGYKLVLDGDTFTQG